MLEPFVLAALSIIVIVLIHMVFAASGGGFYKCATLASRQYSHFVLAMIQASERANRERRQNSKSPRFSFSNASACSSRRRFSACSSRFRARKPNGAAFSTLSRQFSRSYVCRLAIDATINGGDFQSALIFWRYANTEPASFTKVAPRRSRVSGEAMIRVCKRKDDNFQSCPAARSATSKIINRRRIVYISRFRYFY